MIRFFGILLLNIWRGLRRKSKESIPAAAAVLASVAMLLVGSNVAADAAVGSSLPAPSTATSLHTSGNQTESMTVLALLAARGNMMNPKHAAKAKKSNYAAVGLTGENASDQLSSRSSSDNKNSQVGTGTPSQTPGQPTTLGNVQLGQVQTVCEQGQLTYTVPSAQLTLQTPATIAGTATWYWETRIDAGTNTSGSSPISNTQYSQSFAAGTATATLTASDPSQPLLSAPASSYAYSFRLHVVIGSTDVISAWVSVPQEAGGC